MATTQEQDMGFDPAVMAQQQAEVEAGLVHRAMHGVAELAGTVIEHVRESVTPAPAHVGPNVSLHEWRHPTEGFDSRRPYANEPAGSKAHLG